GADPPEPGTPPSTAPDENAPAHAAPAAGEQQPSPPPTASAAERAAFAAALAARRAQLLEAFKRGLLANPATGADEDGCAPSATVKDAPSKARDRPSRDRSDRVLPQAALDGKGRRAGGDSAADACPEAKAPKSKRTTAPGRTLRRDGARAGTLRDADGVPTAADPSMSLALPGAVPVGVPNFFIDKFRIPPFLLPIYQAAGIEYGIRWEILAAINEIETDYGRNLNVSSAGALGWMQFMPATWKQYGTDANGDGRKDPFNPVDAIFSAARYLRAAGADTDLRKAIFAYNRADWYVESVLMRARLIGGLPSDLVGSLNGLTQGHFPLFATARYADDLDGRRTGDDPPRSIDIFARAGSPAIAVQDGTITAIGRTKRLGDYVKLRDAFGNTYTYGNLKKVARDVPVPKRRTQTKASIAKELALPQRDPRPTRAASAGRPTKRSAIAATARTKPDTATAAIAKERLFAHPGRRNAYANGGAQQILEAESSLGSAITLKSYFTGLYGLDADDVALERMTVGRRVIAGTILGRIGTTSTRIAPHLRFEIRPAGRGAPRIDPKPILDGWKLLESTAIYRARGRNALVGRDARGASIGQIMLMSKDALAHRVLDNPRIEIYSCGRRDIEAGLVDRRVLALLEFLAAGGLKPTVSSLQCGHGHYTASGNVSAHSSGNAVDIAKVNGLPIAGNQGAGSITDLTIRRLLTLQGTAKPSQIISLMTYEGTDNTLAMRDHADHIHVGFRPQFQPGAPSSKQLEAVLKPSQWIKLIDRLSAIENPTVAVTPSKYAIPAPVTRGSASQRGE
ncbi:MAG: lytic murein transglycosylase, partial [Solirubrobacteraceae bacterium]|nr:lytic murein transglycosylase [Solirubrobacteraceae bacterium]